MKNLIARVARLGKNIILSQVGRDVSRHNLQLSFLLQRIVSVLSSSFTSQNRTQNMTNIFYSFHVYRHTKIPFVNETNDLYLKREDFKISGFEAAERKSKD
jgi:hypothetical protein